MKAKAKNVIGRTLTALLLVLPLVSYAAVIGIGVQTTDAQETVSATMSLKFYIDSLNPFVASGSEAYTVLALMYDTLVEYYGNGTVVPWLATDWDISEDGKTYTFYLREDATFHDGQPVTSEDVKYTFDTMIEYNFHPEVTTYVTEITAPEDYTVVFELSEPFAPFIWQAGTTWIVPKHAWVDVEDPETYENPTPLGGGPYKFVQWEMQQYCILDAFDDYWMGKPVIDRLTFKVYTNPDAEVLALKAGEIEEIDNIMPQVVGGILGTKDIVVQPWKSSNARYITMNFRVYPLSVRKFRHALNVALDKEEVLKMAVLNYGDLGTDGCLDPAVAYYFNEDVGWPGEGLTDEERHAKAIEMLEDLEFIDRDGDGWRETPNGTALSFTFGVASEYPTSIRAGEIAKADFEAIGIQITLTPFSATTLIDKQFSTYDYEMGWMGWGLNPDPDYLFMWFYSRPEARGWISASEDYSNSTVDDLLTAQRTTPDPEARRAIVYELQEVLADDLPVIMLWYKHLVTAYRTDRFKGWDPIAGLESKAGLMNLRLVEEPTPTPPPTPPPAAEMPGWVYPTIGVLAIIAIGATGYAVTSRRGS